MERWELEHSLTEARDAGYRAYLDGESSRDNPYNTHDEWDLYLAWDERYSNAAWDD